MYIKYIDSVNMSVVTLSYYISQVIFYYGLPLTPHIHNYIDIYKNLYQLHFRLTGQTFQLCLKSVSKFITNSHYIHDNDEHRQ